jgi:hypothetical protein
MSWRFQTSTNKSWWQFFSLPPCILAYLFTWVANCLD